MDWKMSENVHSVQISDRSQPSGLFAAPLVNVIVLWSEFIFLPTCERDKGTRTGCGASVMGGGGTHFYLLFDSDLLVL